MVKVSIWAISRYLDNKSYYYYGLQHLTYRHLVWWPTDAYSSLESKYYCSSNCRTLKIILPPPFKYMMLIYSATISSGKISNGKNCIVFFIFWTYIDLQTEHLYIIAYLKEIYSPTKNCYDLEARFYKGHNLSFYVK